MALLPAALGVFRGAPLLARPLENRTAELIGTVARLRRQAYTEVA